MPRGTIDAIYWRLHTSFLLNERADAEKFLALLCEEAKHDDGAILSEIGPVHMSRFRAIRARVTDGSFGRLHGEGSSTPVLEGSFSSEKKESEVHRWLMTKPGGVVLLACLGASDGATMTKEVELGEYGRCDILIRDGRTIYPVEVKPNEAPSSVVAQVDRYRLACELDMCLGLHDRVVPAVVAASFGPYARQELSRNEVAMICHEGQSLRRLT